MLIVDIPLELIDQPSSATRAERSANRRPDAPMVSAHIS